MLSSRSGQPAIRQEIESGNGTMWAVMIAALTALFGLIGNAILRAWQERNWYAQQRQIGYQDELKELGNLLDALTTSANSRLFQMKRLRRGLRDSVDELEKLVEEYRGEVKSWNISLPTFYNRLAIQISFARSHDLEDEVQRNFVSVGAALEEAIRLRRSAQPVPAGLLAKIDSGLAVVNARLRNFLLGLTKTVSERRSIIREGRHLRYVDGDFSEYSTFQLFKFLFSRDIDAVYVIRPA